MAAPVPKWAVWDGKRWLEDPNPTGTVWKYRPNSLTMEPTANANKTLDDAVVLHPYTRHFMRYRQFIDRYATTDNVYVPPTIVWDDLATIQAQINAAAAAHLPEIVFDGVNLRATEAMNNAHTRLLSLPYNSTRVVFKNSRLQGVGDIFGTYQVRLGLYNCEITSLPPRVAGKSSGWVINGDEIIWLEVVGCTFPRLGKGIYVHGRSDTHVFMGSVGNGDHVLVTRNLAYDADGRRSNGAGDYYRSPYCTTNNPPAGTLIGSDVANFLRINECPGVQGECSYNIIINRAGSSRPEDVITCQGGSGGMGDPFGNATAVFTIKKNFIVVPGQWDPSYVEGVSTTYVGNSSGTGWTDQPGAPGNSQTAILVGDAIFGNRHDSYSYNSSYVVVEDNYAVGFRPFITQQGGHHNTFRRNKMYKTPYLFNNSTVAYSPVPAPFFQITDYHNGDTAPYNNVQYLVWGFGTYTDNWLYSRAIGAGTVALAFSADASKNGGTASGNMQGEMPTDGSGNDAFLEYMAMVKADGVTIGCTLPAIAS